MTIINSDSRRYLEVKGKGIFSESECGISVRTFLESKKPFNSNIKGMKKEGNLFEKGR